MLETTIDKLFGEEEEDDLTWPDYPSISARHDNHTNVQGVGFKL